MAGQGVLNLGWLRLGDDSLQPHLGGMVFLQPLQTEIREVSARAKGAAQRAGEPQEPAAGEIPRRLPQAE